MSDIKFGSTSMSFDAGSIEMKSPVISKEFELPEVGFENTFTFQVNHTDSCGLPLDLTGIQQPKLTIVIPGKPQRRTKKKRANGTKVSKKITKLVSKKIIKTFESYETDFQNGILNFKIK